MNSHSRADSWLDAAPDLVYAGVLAAAAAGMMQVSEGWRVAILDMALWELPIQVGASFSAACAASVRSLKRTWLTISCALFGLLWTAGPFYWHEISHLAPEQLDHLLKASGGIILARFWMTWRTQPAALGLDAVTLAALFLPPVQSMIFYSALLVIGLPLAIAGYFGRSDSDPGVAIGIIAAAYFVRGLVCLPALAHRLRRRLFR